VARRRLEALLAVAAWAVPFACAAGGLDHIDWRGVAIQGPAPPELAAKTTSQLVVALRPLGLRISSAAPVLAEVRTRCSFSASRRSALCVVEALGKEGQGPRVTRHADIPFKDAEDLAASLALLVSDALTSGFQISPVGPAVASVAPPQPESDAGVVEPGDLPAAPSPVVDAPDAGPSPVAPPPEPVVLEATVVADAAARATRNTDLEAAFAATVDGSGGPTLYGANLRALYGGFSPLRWGIGTSLGFGQSTQDGIRLAFFRLLAGPLVGAGLRRDGWAASLTLGPALVLHVTDPHAIAAEHVLATAALVAGARFSVSVLPSLDVVAGADCAAAATREQVFAPDGQLLAAFGFVSVSASLGLSYRL
jgi:hypothetical protein